MKARKNIPADTNSTSYDRDLYRKVKNMDKATLEALILDIYRQGYEKGAAEAVKNAESLGDDEVLDLRKVEADIRKVKGIGEKRASEIMEVFKRHLHV